MDKRLKNIVDNFETMKIGVDDAFQFRCTMCGKCCINRDDILLTPRDMYNLAKELGITTKELFDTYCESYIGSDSRIPIVRLKPRGSVKRCPFLKDGKCSVHKAKPTVCALFPIGRCLTLKEDADPSKEISASRIRYFFTDPGCGDRTETHTVREWLQDFGISLEDEFFVKWQQAVVELSRFFRKAETMASERVSELSWTATFVLLYLHYDVEQDFMPQYEKNIQGITALLQMAPMNKNKQ